MSKKVSIIGAGLAGSEAAWQLAERGVKVRLFEMRPDHQTAVHQTGDFAELVCSNSFKNINLPAAAATLKAELERMGSFVLQCALQNSVAAGQALAVDRELFAQTVTSKLQVHPNIEVIRSQIAAINDARSAPDEQLIVATGPLTSDDLAADIARLLGREYLAFFDAAAPIVLAQSLDMNVLFFQSRYDKSQSGDNSNGAGDYLNAPMDKQQYQQLIEELTTANKVIARNFETKDLFQACQPVEEVAKTGIDSLRHGALKPVGLTDPSSDRRPYAVVQLRAENIYATAYNLVGFQTNLTFAEQERVFKLIPGLQNAEFVRFGVMHRNTFIDTPQALGKTLELPADPSIRFAGQITGTEGYTEAIASGLYAALNCYSAIKGETPVILPKASTFGALLDYATNPMTDDYQPMHVNYGIMEPLPQRIRNKQQRYQSYCQRALDQIDSFIAARPDLGFLPELTPESEF